MSSEKNEMGRKNCESRIADRGFKDELIATEFCWKSDFLSHEIAPVTFARMRSPFYEGERWAVRQGCRCLNKDGGWEIEPQPSSRDDEFYSRCRFKLEELKQRIPGFLVS